MPVEGWKSITIPEEIWEILKEVSEKTGKSMSELVSEAIKWYISKKKAVFTAVPQIVQEA